MHVLRLLPRKIHFYPTNRNFLIFQGTLDTSPAFATSLNAVISENSAVFGTLLTAEAGDGSSGLSEFGNPAFIVTKLLEQTGSTTRDIVDLSSSINSLSLLQLSQLGVAL